MLIGLALLAVRTGRPGVDIMWVGVDVVSSIVGSIVHEGEQTSDRHLATPFSC